MHAIWKNKEALVVSSKQTGIEVNAEKTKYMIMSRDKYPGQNHNIKIQNKAFKRVEQFIYLETILTNQNFIHEDIKSRMKYRNVYYHSAQNLLSSSLYSKI